MRITPARGISGRVSLPGDKSISHRAAIITSLARGTSKISNFSTSQDCESTLACLQRLGVEVEREGNGVRVSGRGGLGLREPTEPLDCGNSGSTMRILAGVLAGQGFVSTLTGDESLRSRPMKRIIEPLELMGARVSSADGRAPMVIEGRRPLTPITYVLPVASAQVKSCVLLAGLSANGRTEVVERFGSSRTHTEVMLHWFGVPISLRAEPHGEDLIGITAVEGPAQFAARDISIPGDISSAAYFIAAASLLPGSKVEIMDVGVNPSRTAFLMELISLGADVCFEERRMECNEPLGVIHANGRGQLVSRSRAEYRTIRGKRIPQLIDELPLLAVVGTKVRGGIEIRDASELRLKETDRIAATVKNLRAMGAEVEEYEDGLAVAGPTRLRGATLDSYGDHRIAMAFAVAALVAVDDSEIIGAECVGISCPEFFTLLESIIER
jgi:3-phosphoshikimate 1-carboxyvinyltransferase